MRRYLLQDRDKNRRNLDKEAPVVLSKRARGFAGRRIALVVLAPAGSTAIATDQVWRVIAFARIAIPSVIAVFGATHGALNCPLVTADIVSAFCGTVTRVKKIAGVRAVWRVGSVSRSEPCRT